MSVHSCQREDVRACCHGDDCSTRYRAAEVWLTLMLVSCRVLTPTAHQCDHAFSLFSLASVFRCSSPLSLPPPALPDSLSICPSLTSSSSFSPLSVPHPFLCPSFLIGCISPRGSLCHAALEWVRVCLWNHMCVFVCELVHCSQAVGRAWVMTPEQLFRPSGPFLYSQPNSWLPPSHYCTYPSFPPSLPPQLYSLAYLLPISSLFPLSALFFFYVTRV